MNKYSNSDAITETLRADLRLKAEKIVSENENENIESLSLNEVQQLLHQLRVHQIELEMQNEELYTIQASLDEQRVLYCDLYDLAPVGYCTVDETGIIQLANLTAAALLETTKTMLVKHSFDTFIFTEDQDIYYLLQKKVMMKRIADSCVLRMIKEDGTPFWGHVAATAVTTEDQTELRIVFYDMTKRKEAEIALKEEKKKYQLLADYAKECIFLKDANGEYLYVSPACEMISGYKPEEFLVDTSLMTRIIHLDDRDAYQYHLDHLHENDINEMEFRIVSRDGCERWISHYCDTVYDENGLYLGRRGSNRDITEKKSMELTLVNSEEKLHKSLIGTITAMSLMVEARDPYTAGHQKRVAALSVAISKKMGMTTDQIEGIELAAKIHDIGKIKIPAEILVKPNALSNIEFLLIKMHPEAGYEMIKDIEFPWKIADIIRQHHEKWDGSGYPHGLKRDEILLEARIISVADIVEAVSSHRPYRAALGVEVALEIITQEKGTKLDPDVVDACIALFKNNEFCFI